MYESIIFKIKLLSFLGPIFFRTIRPEQFQIKSNENAEKRGWSKPIILLTAGIPYLTLYTQIWILIALWYLTPRTMYIAQSLSSSVFILYHSINFIGPMHLTYHSEDLIKKIVRWTPPFSMYIIPWFGLHVQHTFFPFYLYYISIKYKINYDLKYTLDTFIIMGIYILWHLFCWHVHDMPAYPFFIKLRKNGYEIPFYITGFSAMALINLRLSTLKQF
jgi:hypothetical protein